MIVCKEFDTIKYKVYLVKVPRRHLGYPKKHRGNKFGYIIYVKMNQSSFGCRIKNYKWALKKYNNICAHIKTIDENATDIFSLWESVTYLPDKYYLNKDYVPTYVELNLN